MSLLTVSIPYPLSEISGLTPNYFSEINAHFKCAIMPYYIPIKRRHLRGSYPFNKSEQLS